MVEYLLLEYLQFKDHGQMMKVMDGLLPSGVRFSIFVSRIHQGKYGPDRLQYQAQLQRRS